MLQRLVHPSCAHTHKRLANVGGQSLYTSLGRTKRVVLSHGSALSTHENATCSYILLPRAVILSTTISRLFSLASFFSILNHVGEWALFDACGTSCAHTHKRLANVGGQSLYTILGRTKRVVLSHGSALSTHENAPCSYILLPRAVILSTTISRLFSLASFRRILEHFVAFASFDAYGTSGAHTHKKLAHLRGQPLYTILGRTKRVVLSHGSALCPRLKMPHAPIYFFPGLSSCLPPSPDCSV